MSEPTKSAAAEVVGKFEDIIKARCPQDLLESARTALIRAVQAGDRAKEMAFAFETLRVLTKKYPAPSWTPEYRELAEAIHSIGREAFYVDADPGP